MTIAAPHRDRQARLRELDERVRRAWGIYREALRELDSAAYEAAEARAWERLQRRLGELDQERSALVEPDRAPQA